MGAITAGRFVQVCCIVEPAIVLLGPNSSFIDGAIVPCDGGQTVGFADGSTSEPLGNGDEKLISRVRPILTAPPERAAPLLPFL